MKRIVLLIGLLIDIVPALRAEGTSAEAMWERANTLYINGDYAGAAEAYEAVAAEGYVSGKLFYNLGNAYFKADELGRAILNYNKALKLSPYDGDVAYNLAVANGYVKDKIETVPEFFVSRWVKASRASLDSNTWALLSLVLLVAALAGVLVFLLAERRGWRKAGFFWGIVCFLLTVCTAVFAAVEKRELLDASRAVVLVQAVAVKSAPEKGGSDLFILHEGTQAEVLSSYGEWREVMIADGNKGWVPADAVALITY